MTRYTDGQIAAAAKRMRQIIDAAENGNQAGEDALQLADNAERMAKAAETNRKSLRDWFAGQAMRAAIDNDGYEIAEGRRLLAINCYLLADAMLSAREAERDK